MTGPHVSPKWEKREIRRPHFSQRMREVGHSASTPLQVWRAAILRWCAKSQPSLSSLLLLVHFLLSQSGCAIGVRMKVVPALLPGLLSLYDQRVRLGVSIMTYAGHLPGDLHARSATGDAELVVSDFLSDVEVRSCGADGCELITEIGVKSLKPLRQ